MGRETQDFFFQKKYRDAGVDLRPRSVSTLQANITKMCNQACVHCHVDASPRRREMMSRETMDACLEVLASHKSIHTLDITGGAPELHPDFRYFVASARKMEKAVLVRHNLTVTWDPHPTTKESLEDLPAFFADSKVTIISSLPYYQEFFTDRQRGSGVFKKSIKSLQVLNELGFGRSGTGRILNLIYNPAGSFLPAAQKDLEKDYKQSLAQNFGVEFNELFALTNMPIHRFKAQLNRSGSYESYMETLMAAFNPTAASGVMCRDMVSVAYDGSLYDCDFNQMLEMRILNQLDHEAGSGSSEKNHPLTIHDFDLTKMLNREILVADHCFGCTAGCGSSCGGNTA
jgi:radical SAM/Cys-rich protein